MYKWPPRLPSTPRKEGAKVLLDLPKLGRATAPLAPSRTGVATVLRPGQVAAGSTGERWSMQSLGPRRLESCAHLEHAKIVKAPADDLQPDG